MFKRVNKERRSLHGYEDFDGDGADEDVTDVNDGAGLGDGALISNTEDLTRFYQALSTTFWVKRRCRR